MTGYVRADVTNEISNGNIIDAAPLVAEFNAVQTAFSETTGHNHDGTVGEGAPITVVGPAQEYVSDGVAFYPKTDNTYDLGKSAFSWKNGYFKGTVEVVGISINGVSLTATPAELNTLDGITATVTELNILDGATVTASELNILDGATLTTSELNILDGVVATTSEVNYLSGVTSPLQTQIDNNQAEIDTKFDIAGGTFTGPTKTLEPQETVVTLSGTTPSINLEAGSVFTLTTSGNTTFTFLNPALAGTASSFSLLLTSGGTHTITWPASVKWTFGSAPAATASGETDLFVFFTVDAGSSWYGFISGDGLA